MAQPDFRAKTKQTLAKRAGQMCSNPACRRVTSGPHSEDDKSVNLGEAAHIKAARSGQARYDSGMTDEQRQDIANGIWLCTQCARRIDTDEALYPDELLIDWKKKHEDWISQGRPNDEIYGPVSKPLVENGYASLTLYDSEPYKRLAKISFLITNPGPNKCSIRDVELIGSMVPKLPVNLVSVGKWPGSDVRAEGPQKLPLLLPVDDPIQVFIHTENSDILYKKDQYPETMSLNIILNHMDEPLTRVLLKQADGHQYKEVK